VLRRTAIMLVLVAGGLPWLVAAAPTQAGPIVPPPGQVPEVGVTPPVTKLGATVRANLNGWRVPLVDVSICGDDARRGSQDCDQTGSIGVLISRVGEGSGRMVVHPPIGCPCVIRASTPDNSLVRTAPIEVRGFPMLRPDQMYPPPGELAPANRLLVTAHLEDRASAASWFGAPTGHRLVLVLQNLGSTRLSDLSVSASVGREGKSGQPVSMPPVAAIPPYREVRLSVPVELPWPTYGSFVAAGKVDGLARPVPFFARASETPLGLVLVGVVGGVALALLGLRHRERSSVARSRTSGDAEANTPPIEPPIPEPDTTLTGSELQEQPR
jgi:hypothetical protein